jgi:hypothetical protein
MLVLHHLLRVLFTLHGVFYAISGTNLLTRCQFPIFCYFCVLEKLHRKYSRNWTKKSRYSYFSRTKDKDQTRAGGEPEGSHTIGWRGSPLAAPPSGEVALVAP